MRTVAQMVSIVIGAIDLECGMFGRPDVTAASGRPRLRVVPR
jgi:hypothetical protein